MDVLLGLVSLLAFLGKKLWTIIIGTKAGQKMNPGEL